jgi:hypothetical protein
MMFQLVLGYGNAIRRFLRLLVENAPSLARGSRRRDILWLQEGTVPGGGAACRKLSLRRFQHNQKEASRRESLSFAF